MMSAYNFASNDFDCNDSATLTIETDATTTNYLPADNCPPVYTTDNLLEDTDYILRCFEGTYTEPYLEQQFNFVETQENRGYLGPTFEENIFEVSGNLSDFVDLENELTEPTLQVPEQHPSVIVIEDDQQVAQVQPVGSVYNNTIKVIFNLAKLPKFVFSGTAFSINDFIAAVPQTNNNIILEVHFCDHDNHRPVLKQRIMLGESFVFDTLVYSKLSSRKQCLLYVSAYDCITQEKLGFGHSHKVYMMLDSLKQVGKLQITPDLHLFPQKAVAAYLGSSRGKVSQLVSRGNTEAGKQAWGVRLIRKLINDTLAQMDKCQLQNRVEFRKLQSLSSDLGISAELQSKDEYNEFLVERARRWQTIAETSEFVKLLGEGQRYKQVQTSWNKVITKITGIHPDRD